LAGPPIARELVETNHYSLKSVHSFLVKRARGLPNRAGKSIDLAYWVKRNFNTETNTSIQRSEDGRSRVVAELMGLSGVTDAHAKSVTQHQVKFAQLIKQSAIYDLFTEILLAGDSQVLSTQAAHGLYRMYQGLDRD
ncbi:MAG: hypothetical protein ACPGRD_05310, partial [Planktomarina sp.]